MAAIPPVGTHVDLDIGNCVVLAINADSTYFLVQVPGGDPLNPIQIWVPFTTGQVTVVQSLPVSWPPVANDLWIVPGVSKPAFVVSAGGTALYFCQGTDIIALVTSQGKTLPLTTDMALAKFGSALVLLYRPPLADD